MKYLKYISESKYYEDYGEILDDILLVDTIIKKDFKNTFYKYDIPYSLFDTILLYLNDEQVFSIFSRSSHASNREYYINQLDVYSVEYNSIGLEDFTLKYSMGILGTQPYDDVKSIVETIERKYDYIDFNYNNSTFEVHYKLESYLNLISDNYKKINK